MNATVLPEKQEVRRNPKADGDGFMASIIVLLIFRCLFSFGLCFMCRMVGVFDVSL